MIFKLLRLTDYSLFEGDKSIDPVSEPAKDLYRVFLEAGDKRKRAIIQQVLDLLVENAIAGQGAWGRRGHSPGDRVRALRR